MIRYVVGDATRPLGQGPRVIAHVVNTIGAWGAGFVVAVSRRWPEPERDYRELDARPLGSVQFVSVGEGIVVANMIAQEGVGGPRPLRYGALVRCLERVRDYALTHGASLHAPRLGCGLAGGRWQVVEPLIEETLCAHGVDVTVYDLEPPR